MKLSVYFFIIGASIASAPVFGANLKCESLRGPKEVRRFLISGLKRDLSVDQLSIESVYRPRGYDVFEGSAEEIASGQWTFHNGCDNYFEFSFDDSRLSDVVAEQRSWVRGKLVYMWGAGKVRGATPIKCYFLPKNKL